LQIREFAGVASQVAMGQPSVDLSAPIAKLLK
jgi:hypothetical protein